MLFNWETFKYCATVIAVIVSVPHEVKSKFCVKLCDRPCSSLSYQRAGRIYEIPQPIFTESCRVSRSVVTVQWLLRAAGDGDWTLHFWTDLGEIRRL